MPINPNIALAFKPVEIQQTDPLRDYAAVSQIQTSQIQNQLARQQMEQEQGVLNYLRGGANLSTPEGRAGLRQFGKTGLGYEKLLTDQEMNALKRQELEGKLRDHRMTALGTGLTSVLADPSDANLTAAFDRLDVTGVDTKPFRAQLLPMTPDQRKAAITSYVTSNPEGRQALAFVQPKPEKIDLNGKVVVLDMNPNSPTYQQPVKEFAKTASPGELLANARALERLQFEKEKENKPVFNAAIGGFVTPPTAANPQGTFTPVSGVQDVKDQQAAVRALRSAGYDPTTGEDTISKLIRKSTSGGAEALGSATLAFFGKTTEGRKAIAALEGTANQIATDLAGGKLGAGISNTDRDFIVSALGDVANPNKTADERLAGWTAAKDRMVRAGLIPPPTQGAGAAKPEAAPPAGVDAAVWKVMTPEERALWQKK